MDNSPIKPYNDMDDSPIDFCALEKELHGRIQADERYWQQNDAKFRAVEQKVATYEDFRQMVMAAHLKPLDKTDKVHDPCSKYVIWNTIAGMRNSTHNNLPKTVPEKTAEQPVELKLPSTIGEFLKIWRCSNQINRLKFLKKFQILHLQKLFIVDIPIGILNDIFELFLFTEITKSDIVFIVGILEMLTKSHRFNLNMKFLSSSEINTGRELFHKLNCSIQNWKEELGEEHITEEMVNEIKKKYQM